MIWTDVADRLLVKLWNDGGSLDTIALGMEKAGFGVLSRNAIAGRKHRLPPELFHRSTTQQPPNRQIMPSAKIKVSAPVPITEAKHNGPKVQYLKANDNHCKAILNERGGPWGLPFVCGLPRTTDYLGSRSSYCLYHHNLYTHAGARRPGNG